MSLLSLGYGIYFARETGWHGLVPMGSGDHPGTSLIWYFFILGAGFWLLPSNVRERRRRVGERFLAARGDDVGTTDAR